MARVIIDNAKVKEEKWQAKVEIQKLKGKEYQIEVAENAKDDFKKHRKWEKKYSESKKLAAEKIHQHYLKGFEVNDALFERRNENMTQELDRCHSSLHGLENRIQTVQAKTRKEF